MVSDSEMIARLREFLSTSDLDTTTNTIVRRRLEEDFGIDLSDRKVFIREQVGFYMQSQLDGADNEEEINDGEIDEEMVEEREEEEEEEEEGEAESVATSNSKSSTKKRLASIYFWISFLFRYAIMNLCEIRFCRFPADKSLCFIYLPNIQEFSQILVKDGMQFI